MCHPVLTPQVLINMHSKLGNGDFVIHQWRYRLRFDGMNWHKVCFCGSFGLLSTFFCVITSDNHLTDSHRCGTQMHMLIQTPTLWTICLDCSWANLSSHMLKYFSPCHESPQHQSMRFLLNPKHLAVGRSFVCRARCILSSNPNKHSCQ